MPTIESSPEFVSNAYKRIDRNLDVIRRRLGPPRQHLGHRR